MMSKSLRSTIPTGLMMALQSTKTEFLFLMEPYQITQVKNEFIMILEAEYWRMLLKVTIVHCSRMDKQDLENRTQLLDMAATGFAIVLNSESYFLWLFFFLNRFIFRGIVPIACEHLFEAIEKNNDPQKVSPLIYHHDKLDIIGISNNGINVRNIQWKS